MFVLLQVKKYVRIYRADEAKVIMIRWLSANSRRQALQLCDLLGFHSHFVDNPRVLRTNFVHFHADTDRTRASEDKERSETCPETLSTDVVRMFVTIQTGHQYNLRTVTAVALPENPPMPVFGQ